MAFFCMDLWWKLKKNFNFSIVLVPIISASFNKKLKSFPIHLQKFTCLLQDLKTFMWEAFENFLSFIIKAYCLLSFLGGD